MINLIREELGNTLNIHINKCFNKILNIDNNIYIIKTNTKKCDSIIQKDEISKIKIQLLEFQAHIDYKFQNDQFILKLKKNM